MSSFGSPCSLTTALRKMVTAPERVSPRSSSTWLDSSLSWGSILMVVVGMLAIRASLSYVSMF